MHIALRGAHIVSSGAHGASYSDGGAGERRGLPGTLLTEDEGNVSWYCVQVGPVGEGAEGEDAETIGELAENKNGRLAGYIRCRENRERGSGRRSGRQGGDEAAGRRLAEGMSGDDGGRGGGRRRRRADRPNAVAEISVHSFKLRHPNARPWRLRELTRPHHLSVYTPLSPVQASPRLLLSPSSCSTLRAGPVFSTSYPSHSTSCLTAPSNAPSSGSSTRTLRTEALSSPSRVRTSQSLRVTRGRARDTVSRRVMHQRCSDCESCACCRTSERRKQLTRPSELSAQCSPSMASLQTVTCL